MKEKAFQTFLLSSMMIAGCLGFAICVSILYRTVYVPEQERSFLHANAAVRAAKIHAEIQWQTARPYAWGAAFFAFLAIGTGVPLQLSRAKSQAMLKQASVHRLELGGGKVIPIHERDLSIAAPLAFEYAGAEKLEAMNGSMYVGASHATEVYRRMAATANKVGSERLKQIEQAEPLAIEPAIQQPVPTFAEMLHTGVIAPGKPMVLAYEQGKPIHGSFEDIYSSAIAGESGSGKTSTVLCLVGSGVVTGGISFHVIDPHYPHPKSLGIKLQPLIQSGIVKFANYYDEIETMCQFICQTIDDRLKTKESSQHPVVLVIDELAFLAKTSISGKIFHTMERISTEGRKCAVYMLAASQTWLVARTGGNSVVRDTLTSAFVHRIKPKQANALLQNKDEVELIKKHVKRAGEVLLLAVNEESRICQIPLTTTEDMTMIAGMYKQRHETNRDDAGDTQESRMNEEPETVEETGGNTWKQRLEFLKTETGKSQNGLAEFFGMSPKEMSLLVNEKDGMSEDRKRFCETAFLSFYDDIVSQSETNGNTETA